MSKDGKIWRESDGRVFVEVTDSAGSLAYGSICVNPDEPLEKRIYRKIFSKKKIFLPDEYEKAMELINHKDGLILSMNGYSSLPDEKLQKYGIKKGAYEEACKAILKYSINTIRKEFPGSRVFLTYGASDMGVDWAIEQVARSPQYHNIDLLGFSCPEFMMYVKDDDIPVYVAENKDDYAIKYIISLDVLITTGGREHALQHDILAALKYQRRIHFVDLMNNLSPSRNVPATIGYGKDAKVENAPAAFETFISFCSTQKIITNTPAVGDKWDALFNDIASVVVQVCRLKMPADKMFK